MSTANRSNMYQRSESSNISSKLCSGTFSHTDMEKFISHPDKAIHLTVQNLPADKNYMS